MYRKSSRHEKNNWNNLSAIFGRLFFICRTKTAAFFTKKKFRTFLVHFCSTSVIYNKCCFFNTNLFNIIFVEQKCIEKATFIEKNEFLCVEQICTKKATFMHKKSFLVQICSRHFCPIQKFLVNQNRLKIGGQFVKIFEKVKAKKKLKFFYTFLFETFCGKIMYQKSSIILTDLKCIEKFHIFFSL